MYGGLTKSVKTVKMASQKKLEPGKLLVHSLLGSTVVGLCSKCSLRVPGET